MLGAKRRAHSSDFADDDYTHSYLRARRTPSLIAVIFLVPNPTPFRSSLRSSQLPASPPFTLRVEKFGEKGNKTAKVPASLIDFVLGTDQRGRPRRTHTIQSPPPLLLPRPPFRTR